MKTVTLSKPLLGGKVTKFSFREPRFEDFMLLGDPRVPISSGEEDKVFMRPIPSTVNSYAERLLSDEDDPAIMARASLRDTLAIQEAIIGFFRDAETPAKSAASDETSPLEPRKDSATSEG